MGAEVRSWSLSRAQWGALRRRTGLATHGRLMSARNVAAERCRLALFRQGEVSRLYSVAGRVDGSIPVEVTVGDRLVRGSLALVFEDGGVRLAVGSDEAIDVPAHCIRIVTAAEARVLPFGGKDEAAAAAAAAPAASAHSYPEPLNGKIVQAVATLHSLRAVKKHLLDTLFSVSQSVGPSSFMIEAHRPIFARLFDELNDVNSAIRTQIGVLSGLNTEAGQLLGQYVSLLPVAQSSPQKLPLPDEMAVDGVLSPSGLLLSTSAPPTPSYIAAAAAPPQAPAYPQHSRPFAAPLPPAIQTPPHLLPVLNTIAESSQNVVALAYRAARTSPAREVSGRKLEVVKACVKIAVTLQAAGRENPFHNSREVVDLARSILHEHQSAFVNVPSDKIDLMIGKVARVAKIMMPKSPK